MPRAPRVEFPNAIYHVMTRGDGRRKLFHDPGHYERMTRGLKEEVTRSGWKVFAYCWMPNHIHLLVQTPDPAARLLVETVTATVSTTPCDQTDDLGFAFVHVENGD